MLQNFSALIQEEHAFVARGERESLSAVTGVFVRGRFNERPEAKSNQTVTVKEALEFP